jgi:hypothetical protein
MSLTEFDDAGVMTVLRAARIGLRLRGGSAGYAGSRQQLKAKEAECLAELKRREAWSRNQAMDGDREKLRTAAEREAVYHLVEQGCDETQAEIVCRQVCQAAPTSSVAEILVVARKSLAIARERSRADAPAAKPNEPENPTTKESIMSEKSDKPKCAVPGCTNDVFHRGICGACYSYLRRGRRDPERRQLIQSHILPRSSRRATAAGPEAIPAAKGKRADRRSVPVPASAARTDLPAAHLESPSPRIRKYEAAVMGQDGFSPGQVMGRFLFLLAEMLGLDEFRLSVTEFPYSGGHAFVNTNTGASALVTEDGKEIKPLRLQPVEQG